MNHIELRSPDLAFGDADIAKESLAISQALCSENRLTFGKCGAGTYELRVRYDKPVQGKEFTLSLTGDTEHTWEHLRVIKDKPTADRCYRDLTLTDRLYTILNKTVTSWYTHLWDNRNIMPLKAFRDAFFEHCGVPQAEVILPNDDMLIGHTIAAEDLKGKDVIMAICQINGCFGQINEAGEFCYVFLQKMKEGLHPHVGLHPQKGLYPSGGQNAQRIPAGSYRSASFEDFVTETIDKVQIRQDPEDVGGIAGTGENCYIIEDNFLCYGMQAGVLQTVAQNILDKIGGLWYTPAKIVASGDVRVHVGDGVRINAEQRTVYTYVLRRKLTGIQALKDTYTAKGVENYTTKVQTVNDNIVRLTGKTNRLTRTVEELNSQINDEAEGLQSQITQNANAIRAVVTQSYTGNFVTKDMLGDRLIPVDNSDSGFGVDCGWGNDITLGPFRLNAGIEYQARISARSNDVGITPVSPYMALLDSNLREVEELFVYPNRVKEGGSDHYADITGPGNGEYFLRIGCEYDLLIFDIMVVQGITPVEWTPNRTDEYTELRQTAQELSLKVSKGEVSSEISAEAGEIRITSDRFSLESTNCTITADGKITATDVNLSGRIVSSEGEIGGFTIADNAIYSGTDSITSSVEGIYLGNDGIRSKSRYGTTTIKDGIITTDKADITGGEIGGFTIADNAIYSGKNSLISGSAGVYIGTDGIAVGYYGSSPAFKLSRNGDVDIKGSGSLEFASTGNNMELKSTGISFGNGSSYNTTITKDQVKIKNTYIANDVVHCANSLYPSNYCTDISGNKIELIGSTASNKVTLTNTELSLAPDSQEFKIHNSNAGVVINGGTISISGNAKINIGGRYTSGGQTQVLAFFGGTGATQQTVTAATSSTILTQLNALITALKNYGLIK